VNNEILVNTLNRVETKLDNLTTGLATNTAVTEGHSKVLSDMKGVHDVNAKVILDTRDEVKELTNALLRIESWKNGQILYQNETLGNVKSLDERLKPIEADYNERFKLKAANNNSFREIKWRTIERIGLIIGGAILISWKTIITHFFPLN
jgi:hypothetical protein